MFTEHPTKHQLYGHLPPITKIIQVRRTRHARHCWRNRDELISDVLLWAPTHGRAKARRPARTYIQQLCEDTGCSPEDRPEEMNDRENGERGSGISVRAARHDDNHDDFCSKIFILVFKKWLEKRYFCIGIFAFINQSEHSPKFLNSEILWFGVKSLKEKNSK